MSDLKPVTRSELDRLLTLYRSKTPIHKIATRLGRTQSWVYRRLRNLGEPKRQGSWSNQNPYQADVSQLTTLYVDRSLSIQEVAAELGVAYGTAQRVLKEAGLTRPRGRRGSPG